MSVAKTELGQQVIKDRSVQLTPRQRSALILVDGKRSRAELLSAMATAGIAREDFDRLFELGLLKETAAAVPVAAPAPSAGGEGQRTPQERYAQAYPIATQLTASLGLRGFRLNLAVEAAGSYEDLLALAPKIKDAVGADRFAPLGAALGGR
ncbi:hypothetical protein [Ramlibacter humi]|uniref:Uncharacterized protein n=1 Tax=Ramlibacter humi TaxID=2530451 RepID=A0A4Z0CDL2_9BURK|nr:hypothetical protein [Ramlibacter humi]TFZ08618.1 hypothetical protein EZ216_05535 [Ramlibacter humi]